MIVTKITIFSHLFYIWNIAVTMLKYTRIVHVSRIVVIRGAAMIAGSTPTFYARRGRMHPIHFAMATTDIIVIPRAAARSRF